MTHSNKVLPKVDIDREMNINILTQSSDPVKNIILPKNEINI